MADDTAPPDPIHKPMRADSARAWAWFCARVEELGGTVVETRFLNSRTRHRVICSEGHECSPTPYAVKAGWGLCKICTDRDPQTAEAAFRERLKELGATLLEPAYLGSKVGHRVNCAVGHECRIRPKDLQRGDGLCRTCADDRRRCGPRRITPKGPMHGPRKAKRKAPRLASSEEAEARFRARIAELGGTVLAAYVNIDTPVLVRCSLDHEVKPIPGNVLRGTGPCRFCAGKAWDVFYVVQDDLNDLIKFGITSGDPRPRLRDHETDGFDQVVRLHAGLPGDTAPELERMVLAALRDAREKPVRGKEYFPARVLPLILDLVDNHPGIRARSAGASTR